MMTLTNLQWDAFMQAVDTIANKLDIHISTMNDESLLRKQGNALKFGVNWSAWGKQDADTALAFANNLTQAASVARMLTDMQITYHYDDLEPKIDHATYLKYVKGLVVAIECELPDLVVDILNKLV